MTKKLLSYQTKAVEATINHLLDNKEFKLQSPTGSGKTFIISQIIDKYLENEYLNIHPTTFIFIAPSTGALDYQGYEKISQYLNSDWAKGYSTEYIGTSTKSSTKSYLSNIDYFKPNTCYFFGWQMFKKGTKITEIDSEKNDIYKVISNTKIRDINIVLIIDEAHREVSSSKDDINTKQNIINDLDPYKVIKVSATLEQKGEKPDHIITYDDVREEAAIKENVIISQINEKLNDKSKYNEEEQLIISAIEKQKEIKEEYYKNKIDIHPLILIQIPDKINLNDEITSEDKLLKRVESILEKQGFKKKYNYVNWLSDDKTIKNKKEIIDNKSSIEILIFKTAIATGWDIPRANILVRIREAKTKAFNIQTLGRILRNPFFKYYGNNLIDNAFVYTRDEKYKEYIKEEKIVSDESETFKLKRSKASQNSAFSLNKVLIQYKNDYDEENMIKSISNQIINNKNFINNFFQYEKDKVVLGQIIEKSIDILQGDATSSINKNIEKQREKVYQSKFNFDQPKITLFDLYIKFRTITKSSPIVEKIVNEISILLKNINKKIKDFYWACYYNWNENCFELNNGIFISLKQLIEKLKDEYLSKHIEYKQKEYKLPNEYVVSMKKFDISVWDNLNTFNGSLKIKEGLDSENERIFYQTIINKDNLDNIHLFRNGTNLENDYYIEYIDKNDSKIRKFFPDFILINEKNKQCLIIEAKGNKNDIDPNSDNKFKQFVNCLDRNKIKINYNCQKIIKVYENNSKANYIDKNINEQIKWEDIKKILDI